MATDRRSEVKFTYGDYQLLPEEKRCELIEGEFHMTPAPFPEHQSIVNMLAYELTRQLQDPGHGRVYPAPIDVVLSNEDVVQPDVPFIARDRLGIVEKKCIRGAPDLVIEILSPSTTDRDRVIKRKLYDKFGAREFWIVDPEAKSVEVVVRRGEGFPTDRVHTAPASFASPTFPQLTIELARIFA